jgi:hypothetical protein
LLIAGALLLALAGCERDGIETHRVLIPPPPEMKVRLLGAMIPHDQDMWFFKVVGPLDAIDPLEAPFKDFIRSVRFDKPGEPITWAMPKEWAKAAGEQGQRYATLRAGSNDDAPELTVHRFPAEGKMGDPGDNVERWGRMYVGVKVGPGEWKNYTQDDKTAAGGVPITFVDMKGPGAPQGGRGVPPMAGGAGMPNPHARGEKISYTAPEGWMEGDRVVQRGGIRVEYDVALKLEKDGRTVDLTVSKFATGGGLSLLQNINRWREQIGLAKLDEAQLKDAVTKVKVGNAGGLKADFTGPGNQPGKGERRIIGVVVPRETMTWYIKMDGPAALVGEQQAAFDKFLGSVKFDGGNGG